MIAGICAFFIIFVNGIIFNINTYKRERRLKNLYEAEGKNYPDHLQENYRWYLEYDKQFFANDDTAIRSPIKQIFVIGLKYFAILTSIEYDKEFFSLGHFD